MKTEVERLCDNIEFAVNTIAAVAEVRHNREAFNSMKELEMTIRNLKELKPDSLKLLLTDIRARAQEIAAYLLAAVKFELREVLIPFIEVKKGIHMFGAKTFPDYFIWLDPENLYSAEDLVSILENQYEKLTIALKHLKY